MNRSLRKNIYWGGALTLYASMVTALFCMVFELDVGEFFRSDNKSLAVFDDLTGTSSPYKALMKSNEFSGVLLPAGPNDGKLPGLPEIWDEFLRAGEIDTKKMDANGFDGLQAVKNVEELSKGAVGELFLAVKPLQVFRRGQFFLLLKDNRKVQIVNCEDPHEPVMSGSLPYQGVQHMEMQGSIAYLHLDRPGAQHDKLVVVDLINPHKPLELAQLDLPEQTTSFFLMDRQLVVYESSRGYKGNHSIHLYGFADDYQLTLLGSIKSPLLGNVFLKHGESLLVPDLRAGVRVYDFHNPLQPALIAFLDFPDRVVGLAGHGDIVFVMGTQNRVYVIDLHDPLHPVMSTVVEEANYSASFVGFGDYLYYFTENGYLRVFNASPLAPLSSGDNWSASIVGELVSMQKGDGFTLLGNIQDSLPAAVTNVLTLPDKSNVIDQLFWQGGLVVLDDNGLIRSFRKSQSPSLELKGNLKLPSSQRWIAASNDRLYVGGESTISVIAKSDDDHLVLSGQFEFSGAEFWDGLLVQQTLCVAAGKAGVSCFSVEHPDRLMSSPGWMIPRHLESRIDVRQLATSGGDRVLAAAGAAGLLGGRIDAAGHFQLDGFIRFPVPIYALAVVENFCLVSTGTEVCVVDIRSRDSFQNLGKIAFPGVERFAVAAPDFWAGYVPGVGWSALPVPRFVLPDEMELLETTRSTEPSGPLHGWYRLNLFNDHEIIDTPGFLNLSFVSGSQTTGAAYGLQ